MRTFYTDEIKEGWIFGTRYRFRVTLRTAPFTGEAYHVIVVDSATTSKNFMGVWGLNERYSDATTLSVHCCYNAREAAEWAAQQLGIQSPIMA